jgi:phage FluMu protein Com
MASNTSTVVYRAGRCAMCARRLAQANMQDVHLHIVAPAGGVMVRCSVCNQCRPTEATLACTTAGLLARILRWYTSTPSVWPALVPPSHA